MTTMAPMLTLFDGIAVVVADVVVAADRDD